MGNLYEGSYRRVNFKSAIAQIAAVIIFALCSLLPNKSFATHAAGSDLTYKWISGNTYQVTVTFYRDCAGVAAPSSVTLDAVSNTCFQFLNVTLNEISGTGQEITFPCNPSTTLCNGGSGPGIQQYVYRGNITLPAKCSDWVLSYNICCRNCAITTIVHPNPCNSNNTTPELYVEATLNNTTAADGVNKGVNSPVFSNIPEAYLCANQSFTYNEGVVDPDGDSLSYQFIAPKTGASSNVSFVTPFSATNWISSSPAVAINSHTGDITMTPTNVNEVAVCAVLITAYRHGVKVGSVIRDMQFRVNNCSPNLLPTATGINGSNVFAATICPGSTLSFTINSNDANVGDIVVMTWDSGIANASFSASGSPHPTGTFSWTPGASDARSQPYQFTVTVRDNACPNNGFQIYSFTITVPLNTINFNPTNISCNGFSNGAVTATAAGGNGPYTYLWNTSSTSQTISGLSAGTYTITVTDAHSCIADSSITLTQPAGMVITPSSTTSTCFGTSNGSASVSVSGGSIPYTYKWSSGPQTTSSVSGLTGGTTYTVTVTDNNGCTASLPILIPSPAQLVATVTSSTNETCNGQATGSIDLTVSGGTPAYTYLWSSTGTTQDLSNLSAGIYNVTVTDSHGCTVTQTQTITEPGAVHPLITSTTINGVNVACFGDSSGSASVTATGGFGAFTYLWSTGATTQSISNLSAGTVSATVTDANGCIGTGSFTLLQPAGAITITLDSISTYAGGFNTSCNGNNDGAIFTTVTGGTPGYTFSWSNGGTDANISGLAVGPYTLSVTDNNGCTDTATFNITPPQPLQLNVTSPVSIRPPFNLACLNERSGSASANPTGGAAPYTYLWSTGATDQTITNLSAQTYSVTVTDANGCSGDTSITLTAAPFLVPVISTVPVGQLGTPIACNGDSTGEAFVTVIGGAGPFSYLWSNGETTDTVKDLPAGTFFVTVTETDFGCQADSFTVITQPTPIFVGDSLIVNPTCNGGANGSIALIDSGGTPGYTYLWNTVSADITKNVSGLGAGSYTITVTDANGCTASKTDVLTDPAPIIVTPVTITNVTCSNSTNGVDSLAVTGGTAPYVYSWSNGATTQILSGLVADSTYTVVVTDANLCTGTASVTLTAPQAIQPVLTSSTYPDGFNISCFGLVNGSIDVSLTGGTLPYTFNWSNGDTTQNISELGAGNYSVTITDVNGCTDTASITLTQPTMMSTIDTLSNFNGHNISCFGAANGTINIGVIGGMPPYTYQWSINDATTQSVSGLTDTTYTVIVTDAFGCIADTAFTLTQPDSILLSITGTDTLTCLVTSDSIKVTAIGGTPPYSYLWSTGATTATVSGLPGDSIGIKYTVLVTDTNGCSKTDSFTIVQVGAITAILSPLDVAGCASDTTGLITSTVTGGLPPYTYMWSSPVEAYEDTSANPINLPAGNYTVTVTDRAGCTTTASATILAPLPIMVDTANGKTQITCFGAANGSIDLSSVVSGGQGFGSYTYEWSNLSTDPQLSGLDTGSYTVTVTDFNGCTGVGTFIITQPAKLVITSLSGSDTVSCSGAIITATVAGGTTGFGTYSYTWSNNINNNTPIDTIIGPVGSTAYTLEVSDFNGCVADTTFTIVQLNGLVVKLDSTDVTFCNTDTTGAASATPIGGVAPFTYMWSNGGTDSAIIHLGGGSYSVTVTDINGCTGSGTIVVNAPAPVEAALTPLDVAGCSSDTTGSITTVPSGGTAPYTYVWTNGVPAYEDTVQNPINLPAGFYILTLTDAHGCKGAASINILAPLPILVDTSNGKTQISCFGAANGAIDLTSVVSGGQGFGSYTYEWSNNATDGQISGLDTGRYTVTVTDFNGCTGMGTFVITEPSRINITLSGQDTVSCAGAIITVTATGGVTGPGTYSYTWSNNLGNNTPTDTILGAVGSTTYSVVVTDFNGCTADTTFTIVQLNGLTVKLDSVDVAGCSNDSTGAVSAIPTGGVAPFTYMWSNSATDSAVIKLPAGVYAVTVTDFNGCSGTGSITVNAPLPVSAILTPLDVAGCSSDTTGSIATSPAGGVAPYTYMWNAGVPAWEDTAQNPIDLAAGNYTVTITDINGCTGTASTTILAPLPVLVDTTNGITQITCFGAANGTIDLSSVVSGGSGFGTYTYLWSNDSTSISLAGLDTGRYTVTVTDLSGCTGIGTFVITEPTKIAISLSGLDTVGCAGAIKTIVATGGTTGPGTYSYTWSNNPGNNTPIDTILGPIGSSTYTVVVTDFNGCTADTTFTIVQLNGITVSLDTVGITGCGGLSTGVVSAIPVGGLAPFTYMWSNGATDSSIINLPAALYCVTITDALGCTGSACTTLHGAVPISVTLTPLDVAGCSSDTTGSIITVPAGGVGPYTYMWSNNVQTWEDTAQNPIDLAAGDYFVTVTDKNGCTAIGTTTILAPLPVLVDTANGKTQITCFGAMNGAIDLTSVVSGGSGFFTYTYLWSNDSTSISLAGLDTGRYTVTVTDLTGCTGMGTFVITEPTKIAITLSGQDTVGCTGTIITVTATGGTTGPGTYTYTWSDNPGNNTPMDTIGSGPTGSTTYTVVVTDFNGCTADTTFTIVQLNGVAVSLDTTGITGCSYDSTGTISAIPTGGVAPFTYAWSNGATDSTIIKLPANSYTVTVTDANGCTGTANTTIHAPSPVTVGLTKTDVTCFGLSNGSATFNGFSGGTPGYTWAWSTSPVNTTDTTITGLAAADYGITVTDSHGCTGSANVTIGSPTALNVATTATNITCNGLKNGSVVISDSTGGVPPYTFKWSNDSLSTGISGLDTGTYSVTITDNNGCTATASSIVTEPPVLSILSLTGNDTLACNSSATTIKTVTGTGGTAPYSYSWSNGVTTQSDTVTGLPAPGRTYTVVVTDANGCSSTDTSFVVIQSSGFTVTVNNDAANKCNGDNSASVNAVVVGGTAPFTYLWSVPQTTDTITGLGIGNYFVTVTDKNGCTGTASATVTDPAAIIATIDTVTNLTCGDSTNGHLHVSVVGGTPPYTYSWIGSSDTTADITGLHPGAYCVSVSDANGCAKTVCANLSSITITINATVVQPSACSPNSGLITVTSVTGGSGNYSYSWSTSNTTNSISGLLVGTYSVTVIDNAGGCSIADTFTLVTTPSITVVQHLTNPSCNGAADGKIVMEVSGGTPPYTYTWSAPLGDITDSATGLVAGRYNFNVQDASISGCSLSISPQLVDPPLPTFSAGGTINACDVDGNSLRGSVSTAGYTGTWTKLSGSGTVDNPNQGNSTVSGLTTGTSKFVWTVTNANHCTYSDTATIVVTPLTANGGTVASSCDSTGIVLHADSLQEGTWASPDSKIKFSNASSPNSSVSGVSIGQNILYWIVSNGNCSDTSRVVYVRKTVAECTEDELKMPTGISPNNDGKNDFFVIHGIDRYKVNNLKIYNRWGDLVFEMDNYTNDEATMWQGQNKSGKQLPDGTYFALLSATPDAGGAVVKLKGYVDVRVNNLNEH